MTLNSCPTCAAPLSIHCPETGGLYESWVFSCGAEVLRCEGDNLMFEEPCTASVQTAGDDAGGKS